MRPSGFSASHWRVAGEEHAGELGRARGHRPSPYRPVASRDRRDRGVGLAGRERTVLERGGDASARRPHALAAADLEFLIDLDEANGIRLHSGDERAGGGG